MLLPLSRCLHLLERTLLILLACLPLALISCRQETPAPQSDSSLVGSYWTEGSGMITIELLDARQLRFTLHTGSTAHSTLSYVLPYQIEGNKLSITDQTVDTPFGEVIIVRGFVGQVMGSQLRADFTTASVEVDASSRLPRFSPLVLQGYTFQRR